MNWGSYCPSFASVNASPFIATLAGAANCAVDVDGGRSGAQAERHYPDIPALLPPPLAWSPTALPPTGRVLSQEMLVESAKAHKLSVKVLRKQRSVGIIPTNNTIYEVLEDIALTVQNQLEANVPFCAFNGGNDVFVDVGNKSLGLEALQDYLGAEPQNVSPLFERACSGKCGCLCD
eukprot:363737-Chlamydomonas_euryale.AAC.9